MFPCHDSSAEVSIPQPYGLLVALDPFKCFGWQFRQNRLHFCRGTFEFYCQQIGEQKRKSAGARCLQEAAARFRKLIIEASPDDRCVGVDADSFHRRAVSIRIILAVSRTGKCEDLVLDRHGWSVLLEQPSTLGRLIGMGLLCGLPAAYN